ncbi:glutathione gamma-glutamylcysteinyltransferase-like [Pocillopora damicornis]|nr:glutathione gamma-glutamylcysteinyltransferase-like [Pocillopora damicornis]
MCLRMYLLRFRKTPGWSSNIYQASRRKIWGNRDHSLDAMSSNTPRTFYGRSLPQNLVDYRSTESKTRLCRALQTGHAVPYLSLSSCFNTQAEPAYCGVSTLAIILNALRIDPQRIWRTIWRWFTEELLECCRPLEDVKVSGITLEEFVCLAHCNGAEATLVRPNDSNEQYKKFIQILERVCTGGKEVKGETFDEENPEEFMAISYSRKTLGQTGDGHFSPVAAMDKESKSVLMFDTARFKYPPYWVPMEVLFQSMLPLDSVTGKSRGYVVLKAKYEYQGRKVACNWSECNSLADCPENDLPVPKPVYKSGQWHCGNWPCSGGPCDTIKPT